MLNFNLNLNPEDLIYLNVKRQKMAKRCILLISPSLLFPHQKDWCQVAISKTNNLREREKVRKKCVCARAYVCVCVYLCECLNECACICVCEKE